MKIPEPPEPVMTPELKTLVNRIAWQSTQVRKNRLQWLVFLALISALSSATVALIWFVLNHHR